ncbi:hypothetical protein SAY86_011835 [Trapa natans]|uniref:WEB family protein n=1 Tax=Trapa natans TaxID=22666 RepID=A0AAN7LVS3_TRANT|nr:hypothetical protein SAY86_011835 [Trapa natans]
MSSKSKSGLSETPSGKASLATPKVGRVSRGVTKSDADSPSPLHNSHLSVTQSPRSVTSKLSIDRRFPKVISPAKPVGRAVKGYDLQAQLNLVQDDLKKAKERIALIEKEKEKVLYELKEAQKLSEGANEKLRDALMAQKRAEESSEIEKFRAIEIEQAGIEAAQKKEEEWMQELEAVRTQHALDAAALLSTTKELQKAHVDLAMASEAKNQALSHADDATKISEMHAEKVEILSVELAQLKALLDSKLESEANENNKIVLQLKEEIDYLRREVQKVKSFEDKLSEKEASVEQLKVELETAKMAESYACSLVEEWKNRVGDLEMCLAEANKLERSASESLNSMMNKLEENNDLLQDAKSEISSLQGKVDNLEMTIRKQKDDLMEFEHQLGFVTEERSEMAKIVDFLKNELEIVKEEKLSALNNEKLAASSIKSLVEEKEKLINDLKISKEEEEKSKKVMENLASALHEASAEARDAREKLLYIQIEHEACEDQMENLRLVLKATNGKYEKILNDARHEANLLTAANEQFKKSYENAKVEWEQKEFHLVDCMKQLEAEKSAMQIENDKLVSLLKQIDEESHAAREEESRLKDNLVKVEAEVTWLHDSLGERKSENMKLKETLLDKEKELHKLIQENEELQSKEAASLKKIEELSNRLEEGIKKNQYVIKGELSVTGKEYDLLPKVVEFSEDNKHEREGKQNMKIPPHDEESKWDKSEEHNTVVHNEAVQVDIAIKIKAINGIKDEDVIDREAKLVESDYKMWESCKIEKDFLPEKEEELESFEDDLDSKVDPSESLDQVDGMNSLETTEDGEMSPTKQQSQKKKRGLLPKFGSLLKKKGASNTK